MMSLADAQHVGVLTRDLLDIACIRKDTSPPDSFLADQDESVRAVAWKAALDAAETAIRVQLREKGVDA
jgi:hypothetical protein